MRRSYEGAAPAAQLTTDLESSTAALTIFCTDLTNWPTGVNGYPFFIVINRGKVNEEKILCSSRTGDVLTVYDVGLATTAHHCLRRFGLSSEQTALGRPC